MGEGPAFAALNAAELATHPAEEPFDAFGAAGKTLLRYEPLGVVSILTPWNFPHTLNVMKVCAALAAGNTVVLKRSPLAPLAGFALARIIYEHNDIPPGVVNVVTPTDLDSSKLLTVDPRIDMVSCTGSSVVGREVMSAAGDGMKRLLLELGGKSASVVLDDATLNDETLQRMLLESCSFHAGQACILHSRLLLPDAIHDEVVDRLVTLAQAIKIGDPTDPDVTMDPLISTAQVNRVQAHVNTAVDEGATVVAGGARPAGLDTGYYFEPTILTGVTPDSTIAQEEVFGPVLSVLRYRGDDEAVRIANNSQNGLSGAVWGGDVDRALAVARQVRTGQIAVNGFGPGGAPFRLSKTPAGVADGHGTRPPAEAVADPALPFAGLKVLDLSTFSAGGYLTSYLGAFGADVVKVESIQRPDGFRYSGAQPFEGEDWYERSPLWQATNLNKRDITLDLGSPRAASRPPPRRPGRRRGGELLTAGGRAVRAGLRLARRTATRRDRRPHAGFRPRRAVARLVGWALNIEQVSGMTAVTGYADGPPCNVQGPADPIVGVHAGVTLLAALKHRRRTGEGQLIEVAQIEVGATVTAEPVIDYSMNGVVRPREGNRRSGVRQGVYPTADDAWVALAVRDHGDAARLATAMRRDDVPDDHDAFDAAVAAWTQTLEAAKVVAALDGIPVETVASAEHMYDLPGLDARGFYEEFEHPIPGRLRYPGWPVRIAPGPARHHRFVAPTLGQHNDEILGGLGLTRDDLSALRRDRVIGERPMG